MAAHQYVTVPIEVTDAKLDWIVEKYKAARSDLRIDISDLDDDPRFKNLGFSTEQLKEIIRNNTMPIRHSTDPVRDIYRSDLGELLLTLYFDESVPEFGESENAFIIPLKNIWDREHNDMPGRGVDLIGYKESGNRIKLLLGEAKVSEQQTSPPSVVHASEDSIYNSQKKYVDDKPYFIRRLSNYSKKLDFSSLATFSIILLALETEAEGILEIVYGCCLVRDYTCVNATNDYGKLRSNQNEFDPNSVHFVIPIFDKTIKETVDLFHNKVSASIS